MLNWIPANRLDSVLDLCVDQLDHDTPEGVLRRHPQSAPQIATLLHMAAAIRRMGELRLSPAAHQRHRVRLRQAVLARQRRRAAFAPRKMLRSVAYAALLAMVTGLSLSGVTAASASALPADSLYRWKRTSENVWMGVQRAPEDAAEVALWLADRRANELVQLYKRETRVDGYLAAEMRYEYQRALAYIGAAPPAAEPQLLNDLHQLGARHSLELTALAEAAQGEDNQRLQASAAISAWAQSATPEMPSPPPTLDQLTAPGTRQSVPPPNAQPESLAKPKSAAPARAAQPTAPGQTKPEAKNKAAQPIPPGQAKRAAPADGNAAQPQAPGQSKPENPNKAAQPVPPGQSKADNDTVAPGQTKNKAEKDNGNGKKP